MNCLPIVSRELRAQARRPSTRWMRWTVALAVGLLSFQLVSLYASFGNASDAGSRTYQFLLGVGFALACAAVLRTADALSLERREGTLGFLFLTDLKARDVVFGKLVAGGLMMFYVLLALAPALALPLLAGGVTLAEVARATLALSNILFLCLAVGLWISTGADTQFRAVRNAVLMVIAIMLIPFWIAAAARIVSTQFELLNRLSPFLSLKASSAREYGPHFWHALFWTHVEAWFFLIAATRRLTRNWHGAISKLAPVAPAPMAAAPRPPRAQITEPVCWRAARLPGQGALLWTAALLTVLQSLPYLSVVFGMSSFMVFGLFQGAGFVLTFAQAALFAWAGARFFSETRRTGELELLVSTPVGANDLLSGQWRALWGRLRWLILLLTMVSALPVALIWLPSIRGPSSLWSLLNVANSIVVVLTLSWVGMWFGLRFRRPLVAVAATVALVKGVPWLIYILSNTIVFWAGQSLTGGGRPMGFSVIYFTVPVIILMINLYLIAWARRRLLRKLQSGVFFDDSPREAGAFSVLASVRRIRHWTPS